MFTQFSNGKTPEILTGMNISSFYEIQRASMRHGVPMGEFFLAERG
ncbi:hypothetical protein MXM41_15970 [Leclercia adecarboxylata]|nr:hypothetical protein [Leclercia adecarboxylata]MEB6380417.1 hypothetical protein [Leclercia adecarboxylata]